MSRVDLRDPKKIYHRIALDELKKMAPEVAWDGVPDGHRRPRGHGDQRRRAGVLQGARRDDEVGADRRVEHVPALAPRCARWRRTLSKTFVDESFALPAGADGREDARAALEALRARRRPHDGRGARAARSCRDDLGAEGKEMRAAHGRAHRGVDEGRPRRARRGWTTPRARRPTRSSARSPTRSAIPTSGGTTTASTSTRDSLRRRRRDAERLRDEARSSARSASRRQGRVGDDAADGERVLRPVAERDGLPGRHPAAAVLRADGRARR